MRTVGLIMAFALLTSAAAMGQGKKAFDYPKDPPWGTVTCGQKATVASSEKCSGKPATIIGGCKGLPRQTKCR